ncbi:siderophore-interacting protein [Microbacterium sp. SSW1-59]|uniref:siderophore-interacting protein n=1 Tax=Microbacterium xanthum TaxID=3079794 RepID=UPI002AD57C86|nr:siderophore-interacting protein [Microbacterium sp. SSW1-59]MDZ8200199.1 siderophore-interacting protein [Microbacterium sp. SSW1-59]
MTASSETTTFRIGRRSLDLVFRTARLTAREWVAPDYVRVRLSGDELRGFASWGADDHIRVFFPDTAPRTVDEMRAAPSREYTPLAWDAEAGWLDLEFALHGDDAVGAPWAAQAPIGSLVGVGGPRGSAVIEGRPDAWFLAGDETAVPAVRRFVALMDRDATGRILIETVDADHDIPLDAVPDGVTVTFVHRGDGLAASTLAAELERIDDAARPEGSVFAFIAAEQSIVKPGRALVRERWGLPADQVIVKGYWKRGEPEYHAPH